MLLLEIKKFKLILATQSPRRHFLMKEAGFEFEIKMPQGIEEVFPNTLSETEIPQYLAELKASFFENNLADNEIVITADTIVVLGNQVLGKPSSRSGAIDMLRLLSGRPHDVVTGVCLLSNFKKRTFSALSKVWFREFSEEEIIYYVDTYKPFDKAGSYGAQEWIGYIGIEHIEGSYFNVMGLPIQMVYKELEGFI